MNQIKNGEMVNQAVYSVIELRSAIIRKIISEAENPDKIIGIVEKTLGFKKKQKSKGLRKIQGLQYNEFNEDLKQNGYYIFEFLK